MSYYKYYKYFGVLFGMSAGVLFLCLLVAPFNIIFYLSFALYIFLALNCIDEYANKRISGKK